jgi:hypothetical protein
VRHGVEHASSSPVPVKLPEPFLLELRQRLTGRLQYGKLPSRVDQLLGLPLELVRPCLMRRRLALHLLSLSSSVSRL